MFLVLKPLRKRRQKYNFCRLSFIRNLSQSFLVILLNIRYTTATLPLGNFAEAFKKSKVQYILLPGN